MAANSFDKDPDAVLDYRADWSDWLKEGDTLTSSDWIVPAGLTEDSASFDTTSATIWLSGGTAGQTYAVTNRVTTAGGRTDDRTIYITVKER